MAKKHDIIWLNTAISTNETAKYSLEDLDNLSVLSALEQTGGKGQRGNAWLSEPGMNLTFSIVLKGEQVSIDARDQFCISMVSALSVRELLSSLGIEAKIKWPNDIYVKDEKICGILIENSLRGRTIQSSIIGIGLNVNQTVFDKNLPNPTSVKKHIGKDLDVHDLLVDFMDIFKRLLEEYIHRNRLSALRDIYTSAIWRLNVPASFKNMTSCEESMINGRITGITDEGLLKIETVDHEVKTFAFKEISYI
jgi:BirA family biotin operon repressor/biotin-[acetyl-CoA-carboxylase] ligase